MLLPYLALSAPTNQCVVPHFYQRFAVPSPTLPHVPQAHAAIQVAWHRGSKGGRGAQRGGCRHKHAAIQVAWHRGSKGGRGAQRGGGVGTNTVNFHRANDLA